MKVLTVSAQLSLAPRKAERRERETMVVEGDREVQQEKQEEQEKEMVDNDEVEQRRKESQPLIVRDTVVEVLLDIDFKFFSLKTVSKLKLSGGN